MAPDSTATSPGRTGRRDAVYRLVVVYAPPGGRVGQSKVLEGALLLSRQESTAGEDAPEGRLVLEDQEVSRRHALVAPSSDDGQGWVVADEGSHNGTRVNGRPVERALVSDGDVVRVGRHLMLVQTLDAAASLRLGRRRPADSPIVGEGPACVWIDEQIAGCAEQVAPVMILGESGTGKELVARRIHALSGRNGPLISVNCTTLAETVADSELFGHVKGAFSGAVETRDGLFAAAQGGTLFLDEIGDLPESIQAKLLRTLETGEVRKVGSSRTIHVDTRVVAATNVDLEKAVREGRFRGDLWARLQRFVIKVPPLRARRDDVLPLVRHFLREAGSKLSVSPDAAEALLVYDWPYNVRELRNVVDAAREAAAGSRELDLEHLSSELRAKVSVTESDRGVVPVGRGPNDAEELTEILEAQDWNIAKVASLFGKDRKQVYRWCEAFGIDIKKRGRSE